MPIAVAPTAAVLPIRQTSTETRPAGIPLPVPPTVSPDAFYPAAPGGAPLPLAVPAFDAAPAPPTVPAGLAAPVVPSFDPAEWGLDIEAAPATGRRRGVEDDTAPGARRPSGPSGPTAPFPARLFGRGKAGAARLLVLALVVGAEGVAVTSMAGHARTAPSDPSTAGINGAYQLAALSPSALPSSMVLEDSAERQRSAVEAQEAALALAQAQADASESKVTAALQQAKAAADRVQAAADRRARAMRNAQRDPRSVGRIMAAERGWGEKEFNCLNLLWNRESQWNWAADNPSSSAYGIPQALPGSKMASAGADWRTNPVTQIKWGLDYIADRYGTPCAAWGHSESVGWY
jgi:murein DD-endopeptidase MepM/ murein hydrolase activator NlpD